LLQPADPGGPGRSIRQAGPTELASALAASRNDTLATFAQIESRLTAQGLRVPALPSMNLPLWELGHVGWFADWWISRNTQRALGPAADPNAPRLPARRADADVLYDSTRVAHASRWALRLPATTWRRAWRRHKRCCTK
jgi:gamma-glutamyl hercynylcysteine S-oxide synthase